MNKKHRHLRNALIFLILWIGAFIVEIYLMSGMALESTATAHALLENSDLLILLVASVFLLALCLRSFMLYLRK
jgi:hypothetical protein